MTKNKKSIRNKILLTIWGILTIGLLIITTFQSVSNIKNGDQNMREKLLVSSTVTIMQDESVDFEDVEDIRVIKMKAGVFPFNYAVIVDLKNGKQLTIQWKDKSMKETKIINLNR